MLAAPRPEKCAAKSSLSDDGPTFFRSGCGFGDLLVDPAKRLVTRDGDTIELTRTEFDILHTLITNAEIVMSRSQLYETIWGYDFETNSKSLDVHIGYLRRKLEDGDRARLVHTVRGIGYVVRAGDSS